MLDIYELFATVNLPNPGSPLLPGIPGGPLKTDAGLTGQVDDVV